MNKGFTSEYQNFGRDSSRETVWKDVFFPMSPPKTTGAGNPTLVTWLGNLRGYSFASSDAHDFDPQEFPHDGKQASLATWHIHFTLRSVLNGDKYNWQLEFSQANPMATYPAPTIVTAEYTVSGAPTAPFNVIFDISQFVTGNIASQMYCKLTRIAKTAGGTNPVTDPVVAGIHYHYELDSPGSRQILTK